MTFNASATDTTTPVPRARVDVRPMSGHIGAELFGVDLAQPLDTSTVSEIRAALLRWKVVFFRDQHITRDQHVAFGSRFGSVTLAHPTLPAAFEEHPEVLLLDNGGKATGKRDRTDAGWHTDVTFVPNPPMASVLRGVVVPEYGGDTHWSNLAVAYERLSAPTRSMIDSMRAVHHNVLGETGARSRTSFDTTLRSRDLEAEHPVVRVHPETGERSLFVNPLWTSHLVGVSHRESTYLLALLYAQIADLDFTVRFRWQPGSIAFWDNRATAHLVPGDVPEGMHRRMERITLAGDLPVGPDGFTSRALLGDTFG
jgi:alpha-ketoglutarate-dependent taurine dioxygenase